MDILEKILKLKNERGWSLYKLADESGVSHSTLSNMFVRKTNPSLTTLKALCDAFDISLSEFFAEDNLQLNELNFTELISNYSKLSVKEQSAILALIKNLKK